jgi:hypothetical protein
MIQITNHRFDALAIAFAFFFFCAAVMIIVR